ncbi:MAG TPA: MFS transporter [Gemmatimonadales bacterium]|nr:MFS transporter [Gemmatimonadales bacterium]
MSAAPATLPPEPARHDPYASLRLRDFRLLILSVLAYTMGTQVQEVVIGWQLYALTKDPLALGFIGLAEALPFITVALFAGHVADRRNRRTVGLASLGVLVLCSAAFLTFSEVPGLLTPRRVWIVYLVIAASGVARSFLGPVNTGLGAELVPRPLYPNAVAWRSSAWQFAAVAGPALGGLLYGWTSAGAAYGVAGGLVLAALAALAAIRYAGRPAPPPEARESLRESIATGLRFVFGTPVILGALTVDLFAVLFGGAVALLPIFADAILHVGPQGLGALRAAPAVGAVLMSVVLAHRAPMHRAGRAMLWAVAAFGACIIGFGLSRSFLLSLALLAASGMVDQVSVVIRSTLIQVVTPESLLGRVSAVNSIFIGSSNEIGAFESGVAARLLGTVPAVVIGGMLTLAVVAATAWRVPALRRMGRIGEAG